MTVRVLKRLLTLGKRGAFIKVDETLEDGVRRYRVQWGPKGHREQVSYPATPAGRREAFAFAESYTAESKLPVVAEKHGWTTRALWEAYKAVTWPHLRPRSKQLYQENWKHWEKYFLPDRDADSMTADDAALFRASLEQTYATKTAQAIIEIVRGVYNYAEATDKITKNRWHQFKFKVAKDRRTKQRAEYKQAEFLAIWRQFDPTKGNQWRGYVAIGLLGLYGSRQTATLHIKDPDDIDEAADTITFRSEWDKQGEEQAVPILPLTRELLTVARLWRARDGYTGPYLLYPGSSLSQTDTWTIQSLWSVLEHAEAKAKIAKIKYRAGHGFRRGLVGDLLEAGNDMDLALKAIGDKDPRMARHYAVKRNERIERALATRAASFDDATEGQTKGKPHPETEKTPPPMTDDDVS